MAITFDIALYQVASPYYVAALATSTVTGRLLTAHEKLAQRFLLELMTEKGSMTFDPLRGCDFITRLRSGVVLNEQDVINIFYTALIDITGNLTNEETSNDETNQRFGGANINSIAISSGVVTMNISVINVIEEAINLSIPVSLSI